MRNYFYTAYIVICLVLNNPLFAQKKYSFSKADTIWAEQVLKTLTIDEKIGQLFMIRVHSNKDATYEKEIAQTIKDFNVGGLCFFQGNPANQVKLINSYQKITKIPLINAIDGEFGLGMRLDCTLVYPRQMALGAINNDSLVYLMGKDIAQQCKRVGIHLNFAPVVDINSNPNNPVINSRAFGSDKYLVAKLALAYMQGLQDGGVMACAKHFPGHGDTDSDSHYTLPIIKHSKATIDTLDLFPFKELIKNGVASIMIAHLHIPDLDNNKESISTLSKVIIDSLLIKSLHYQGLIFTDALEMQGVKQFFSKGNIEVAALIAGNDILLLPDDIAIAVKSIKMALKNGLITEEDINKKCRKILLYKKKWCMPTNEIAVNNIYSDLNTLYSINLRKILFEKSLTVAKNSDSFLPLKRLDTLNIAYLHPSDEKAGIFYQMLSNYTKITEFSVRKDSIFSDYANIKDKLKECNLVVFTINQTTQQAAHNYGIKNEIFQLLDSVTKEFKVILTILGNPYILRSVSDNSNIKSVIITYHENEITRKAAAKLIFGGISTTSKLPVEVSGSFSLFSGCNIDVCRLNYVDYTELGIKDKYISSLDSTIYDAIRQGAFPGCQVLFAYKGNVFYYKSFGTTNYQTSPVTCQHLYDIASLTKIIASTPALMKLVEQKKVMLDDNLGKHLVFLLKTNKENITIRDMMAHQARLKSWIPFYIKTIINNQPDSCVYSKNPSDEFSIQVAENLYIRNDYLDSVFAQINQSELNQRKRYRYSDLGYYYLWKLIESKTKQSLENYTNKYFYAPLGMNNTTFLPLNKFQRQYIVPSENDTIFRKQILQGYVNDPGAAMLGGVCGHAGLFANANDIAKMMQMFLWNGTYGCEQYFTKATVKEFTRQQFPENHNRRGLGFDKPITDSDNLQVGKSASKNSFGHSGFTGTFTWADPDKDLLFVFLSNRTYPFSGNQRINKLDVRVKLHQIAYDAIENAQPVIYERK